MCNPDLRRYFRHGMFPQLMVFKAVARLGSFTRAGEELCLAQPTVSVQMRKLSENLDLPLFEQTRRKVTLTDAGRELFETVGALMKFFGDAEERLNPLRNAERRRAFEDARACVRRKLGRPVLFDSEGRL